MSSTPLVETLKSLLADYYSFYLKTQIYHWNVEGPRFRELHSLFEGQYTELAAVVDSVAELIRGLNAKAPACFEAYTHNSSIKMGRENLTAAEMLESLLADQGIILQALEKAFQLAHKEGDEVVADFVVQRMAAHRKQAWMLRSSF
jgi:starvation-inducible DNA-binding protein